MAQYFHNIYIFLQQIVSDRFILAVISGKHNNFNDTVKTKINNNLPPNIYCENIVKYRTPQNIYSKFI